MLDWINMLYYGPKIVAVIVAIVLLARIARSIQHIGAMFEVFAQVTAPGRKEGPSSDR
jgi:hypothetical protein